MLLLSLTLLLLVKCSHANFGKMGNHRSRSQTGEKKTQIYQRQIKILRLVTIDHGLKIEIATMEKCQSSPQNPTQIQHRSNIDPILPILLIYCTLIYTTLFLLISKHSFRPPAASRCGATDGKSAGKAAGATAGVPAVSQVRVERSEGRGHILVGHSVYFNTAVTKQDILKILRVSSQKRLKTISYYHGNMK